MPIGTPKVPVIRSGKTVFVTLFELLQKKRMLFLCRKIEFPLVNQLIGLILFMEYNEIDPENEDEDESNPCISLLINSKGGGVLAAMALYDTMEFSRYSVSTMNLGLAASAASLILVGGTIRTRLTFPHARVLIHQPSTGYFCGNADEMLVEAEEMCELRNEIAEIYAQNTGQPINVIQNDLERDTFMSATEAQDYGIIDHIVTNRYHVD